jgi:multidrug efflux pump subunit AcrA (membrane-fusion protein)
MKYSALIIIIPFFVFSSCKNNVREVDETKSNLPEVQCVNPQVKTISEYIDLNGVSVFLQKEVVRSTVNGYITEVYANIGEPVKKDQKLFAVKTSEAYALNSKNDTSLFSGLINIKSHKNGVLSVLNYQQGAYIQLGDVLAELAEPENLVIQINVPYEYNQLIRQGKECQIVLADGMHLPGYVFRIMPLVDRVSQTQTIYVKLKTFKELPENLNVTVKILKSSKENAVTLPKTAVLANETQDKFSIMKIVNDTMAVEVPVVKGLENDLETEILSPPISSTDRIIIKGAYGLPDSSAVKILK